jgi:protein ImuA
MVTAKADIIAGLQKELQALQGIRPALDNNVLNKKLGPVINAFPNQSFPLGAIHEMISTSNEEKACGYGFISAILSSLMKKKGAVVWIASAAQWFPPAFDRFDVDADKIIFIQPKEKDIAWITEEALLCGTITAVVSEMKDMNFTTSRRLQLAVERSKTTGFIFRTDPKQIHATSSMARWKVSALPGRSHGNLPGVIYPSWNIELLKVRNGKPQSWQMEYSGGKFKELNKISILHSIPQKKTG